MKTQRRRRRPELSAATATKVDEIKDPVIDFVLLGTIQREVTVGAIPPLR